MWYMLTVLINISLLFGGWYAIARSIHLDESDEFLKAVAQREQNYQTKSGHTITKIGSDVEDTVIRSPHGLFIRTTSPGLERINVTTPSRSFQVSRADESSPWTLDYLGDVDRMALHVATQIEGIVKAPWAFHAASLESIVNYDGVTSRFLGVNSTSGLPEFEIRIQHPHSDGHMVTKGEDVVLSRERTIVVSYDPEKDYRVQRLTEAGLTNANQHRLIFDTSYGEVAGKFSVERKGVLSGSICRFEVSPFNGEFPTAAMYQLSYYGIDGDHFLQDRPNEFSYSWILLASGVALVALWVILTFLRNRQGEETRG